jgi:hypothetical protein
LIPLYFEGHLLRTDFEKACLFFKVLFVLDMHLNFVL